MKEIQNWEQKITNFLETKNKQIGDTISIPELMEALTCSHSTAYNYAIRLSIKFPKHFTYTRGVLFIRNTLGLDDLPPEFRVETMRKEIEAQDQKLDIQTKKLRRVKEIAQKIHDNHLPHRQYKELKEELDKLLVEVG